MTSEPEPKYVQPRVVHNQQIYLAEPDPGWALEFADVEVAIRGALGHRALSIEHVGSTSISGLLAKPILDILLLVTDSADEPGYVPGLEGAGFVLHIREPEWQEHRLFKRRDPDVNLHVFTTGAAEAQRLLRFRDWLRSRPEERDTYARVKRDLALREWEYVQDYADAKSSVVEEILARAGPGGG